MASSRPAEVLVQFEDVKDQYDPKQNLFVAYRISKGYTPSRHDWVGLFCTGWTSIDQYVAFEWAPPKPHDIRVSQARSMIFKPLPAHVADGEYQLVYVTRQEKVGGYSKLFHLVSASKDRLACVEYNLPSDGELTFIEQIPTTNSSGESVDFEFVGKPSPPNSGSASNSCSEAEMIPEPDPSEVIFLDEVSKFSENQDIKQIMKDLDSDKDTAATAKEEDVIVKVYDVTTPPVTALVPYMPIFSLANQAPMNTAQPPSSAGAPWKASESVVFTPGWTSSITGSHKQQPHRFGLKTMSRAEPRDIKKLRRRLKGARLELAKLRNELKTAKENLENKDLVLGDLADTVKLLEHDKASLMTANSALANTAETLKPLSDRAKDLGLENEVLKDRVSELEAQHSALSLQVEQLETDLSQSRLHNANLTSTFLHFEEELSRVTGEKNELQTRLEQILTTLAMKGYAQLVPPEDAGGWQVALSQHTKKQAHSLAAKDEQIAALEAEKEALSRGVSEKEAEIQRLSQQMQTEQSDLENALQELITADGQIHSLKQHVSLLAEEAQQFQAIKKQLEEHYTSREKSLEDRVHSLTNALNDLRITNQQNKSCESQKTAESVNSSPAVAASSSKAPMSNSKNPVGNSEQEPKMTFAPYWWSCQLNPNKAKRVSETKPVSQPVRVENQQLQQQQDCPLDLKTRSQAFSDPDMEDSTALNLLQVFSDAFRTSCELIWDGAASCNRPRNHGTEQQEVFHLAPEQQQQSRKRSRANSLETQSSAASDAALNDPAVVSVTRCEDAPAACAPAPVHAQAHGIKNQKKARKPRKSIASRTDNVPHILHRPSAVITDNTCSRCGIQFPAGTTQDRLDRHITMHNTPGA